MPELLPLFLNVNGRRVLLVGGGEVAAAKLRTLLAAGADVRVVAPDVHGDIMASCQAIERRAFREADVDDVWLVVAAATPEVNRAAAAAAERRRVFVNAVDDPANASAFLSGVVRRDGITLAISSRGEAPGLTALLREAFDAVLPRDLASWVDEARRQRARWRRDGTPMEARRPLLLDALNALYGRRPTPTGTAPTEGDAAVGGRPASRSDLGEDPGVGRGGDPGVGRGGDPGVGRGGDPGVGEAARWA